MSKGKKRQGTEAKTGEIRQRSDGHSYRKRKDGKWERVIKVKGKWVSSWEHKKKKKKKDPDDVYGRGIKLLSIYDKRKATGRLAKYFSAIKEERNKHGVLFTESLDEEIILLRALIAESLEDLQILGEEQKESGRRQWIRGEISEMIHKLSAVMERSVNMKYGRRYSIKIEEVQRVIQIVQQVILRNVSDRQTMEKIVKDMDKTLLNDPATSHIEAERIG